MTTDPGFMDWAADSSSNPGSSRQGATVPAPPAQPPPRRPGDNARAPAILPNDGGGEASGTTGPQNTPSTTNSDLILSDQLDLSCTDKTILRLNTQDIDKLDDNNWREWSRTVMWFLKARQLWGIIDGTIPRPFIEPQRSVWDRYASVINNIFYSKAVTSQKVYIPGNMDVTPRDIWLKWEEVHVSRSDERLGDLIEAIFTKKSNGDGVDKVAADLSRLNDQISQIDETQRFQDKAMAVAVIKAFAGQKRYENIIAQLRIAEVLSVTKIVSKLKSVETHGKLEVARISKEIKPRRNIVCYGCDEKGHIQRNCPNKDKGEEEDDERDPPGRQKSGNRNDLKNNRSNENNRKPSKQKGKDYYRGGRRQHARVAKGDSSDDDSEIEDVANLAIDGAFVAQDDSDDGSDLVENVTEGALMAIDENQKHAALRGANDDELCTIVDTVDEETTWTIDSGATKHMSTDRSTFVSFVNIPTNVRVGGKKTLRSPGRGDVKVMIDGRYRLVKNVLWVPKLGYNLLSIPALDRSGNTITFMQGRAEIRQDGTLIAVGYKANNLYHLSKYVVDVALPAADSPSGTNAELTAPEPRNDDAPEEAQNGETVDVEGTEASPVDEGDAEAVAKEPASLYQRIHERLGHPGKARMESLHKFVHGIPKMKQPPDFFCDQCENNKLVRRIKKYRFDKELRPGGRLFCDIWGPYRVKVEVPGITPLKYFLSVIDEASGYSWLIPLNNRAFVTQILINIIKLIERSSGNMKVQIVRCDNAFEFKKAEPELNKLGIRFEFTTPYTPEQNGTAERFNRTIVAMTRCMLQKAELPDGFWAEASSYSNHLKNLLPMTEGASPFERMNERKPLLDAERTFGSLCKVHIPKEHRTKLDPIAMDGIYLGTHSTTQCRVYIPKRRQISTCTNVKVFENKSATHLLQELFTTSTIGGKTTVNYTPMVLEDVRKEHYTNEYSAELMEEEFGQNLLTNDNPANLPITRIFQKGGVLTNGVLRHPNESIPIESPIAEEEIPPECSTQIQVSSNESAPADENVVLVPENSGVRKPNEDIMTAETPEGQPVDDAMEITTIDQNNTGIVDEEDDPINVDAPAAPTNTVARSRKPYDRYGFDKSFGGSAFVANKNPDPLTYHQAMSSPDSFRWKEAIEKELTSHSSQKT